MKAKNVNNNPSFARVDISMTLSTHINDMNQTVNTDFIRFYCIFFFIMASFWLESSPNLEKKNSYRNDSLTIGC